ncbi:MAG: hypothetical protein FD181_682 [Prolixibacteraceae bacterium]|nr:MAG: hypothetical protein FD181_682 [Prolixibacteraceae bacterium]
MKKFYFLFAFLLSIFSNQSNGQSITIPGGTQYLSVDSITFVYENPGFVSTDWIGIYPEGIKPGDQASTAWQYVTGSSGNAVIKDTIPGGKYVAYLLCCDGYEVKASTVVITILEPKISSLSPSYLAGDTIAFTFESPLFAPTDWIGIYNDNGVPPSGSNASIEWGYIPANSGVMKFTTKLIPGNYIAYLLCCDGYRVLDGIRFIIEDPKTAFVRPVKMAFGTTDKIAFNFNNPDYEDEDWLGVYYAGDDPEKVPAVAWKYIKSTKGTITLDDVLPAGSYEAYIFCCDATDIMIAKSEVFTSAGGAASSFIRTSASVYPPNSLVLINYRSSGFTNTDWIGIYNDNGIAPGSGGPSIAYVYAPADSGTVTFTTVLAPGKYVAYLLCCDGYNVKAKSNFSVGDATSKVMVATSFTFGKSDSLFFRYNNPGFSSTDWIGIYKSGDVPGNINSITWDYLKTASGRMAFANTLNVGEYWAGLFCCDGYELYAKSTFMVVEGTPVSARNIESEKSKLIVFPNPSNGQFTLLSQGNTVLGQVEVFSISGKLMYSEKINNPGILTINLKRLDAGVYILKAMSESDMFTTKIIIQ